MDGGIDAGKQLAKGPKTRVCYICGRQYGLSSYEIHLKQCKELWIAREAQKDPKERKPLPEDPLLSRASSAGVSGKAVRGSSGGGDGGGGMSLEEINKIASDTFNTVALAICEFCGRSFLAEKLVIHNRSCTADKPARRVDEAVRRGAAPAEPTRPTTSGSIGGGSSESATTTPSKDKHRVSFDGLPNNSAPSSATTTPAKRSSVSSAPTQSAPAASDSSNENIPSLRTDGKGGLTAVSGHLGGSAGKPIREARRSSPPENVFKASTMDTQQLQARLEDLEQRACQGLETMMAIVKEIGDIRAALEG